MTAFQMSMKNLFRARTKTMMARSLDVITVGVSIEVMSLKTMFLNPKTLKLLTHKRSKNTTILLKVCFITLIIEQARAEIRMTAGNTR